MIKCNACHEPLGSNKDCEQCLKYLIELGTKAIDENKARQAQNEAQRWLNEVSSVPKKLVGNVRLLVDMIGAYFRGEYTVVPWLPIAACAFALIYVVSP